MIMNHFQINNAHITLSTREFLNDIYINSKKIIVSGTKKPSKKRFEDIIETIRSIGRELMSVSA